MMIISGEEEQDRGATREVATGAADWTLDSQRGLRGAFSRAHDVWFSVRHAAPSWASPARTIGGKGHVEHYGLRPFLICMSHVS